MLSTRYGRQRRKMLLQDQGTHGASLMHGDARWCPGLESQDGGMDASRSCRSSSAMHGLFKLTWLVLGGDPAVRSHRVEQFTAL